MYVATPEQLEFLCEKLSSADMLAIDTEFVREKTYYHNLGLIQVASEGVCAAVDPIALKDLTPLLDLIRKPNVMKVFHAGKQDLEILNRLIDDVVRPIFDTQVAASLIGWGAQISFAKIVRRVSGKLIHKSETYSDWCRRPLSQSQIEYALDDARYLVPVYRYLIKHLKKINRLEWLDEEFEPLMDPANYRTPNPRTQFMRIKNFRTLKRHNLAVLCELAAWRELEAQRRNRLPKLIVRDEPLLEIARKLPRENKGLAQIRGFHPKEISASGPGILQALERGMKMDEAEIPEVAETNNYSTTRGVEELLAAYVQVRSEELKIEPHILADRRQIHDFVKRHELGEDMSSHSLFHGWRQELIGGELHALLSGDAGLRINGKGRVVLTAQNGSAPIARWEASTGGPPAPPSA
ncbi:MAG: ribonuclease D [Nitrospinaceae bacterium]